MRASSIAILVMVSAMIAPINTLEVSRGPGDIKVKRPEGWSPSTNHTELDYSKHKC